VETSIIGRLRATLPRLREGWGVRSIGVFGSCSRGEDNESSDVDMVVEFDRPLGVRFVDFCEEVERLLGRKVDVLTRAGLEGIRNKRMCAQIEREMVNV